MRRHILSTLKSPIRRWASVDATGKAQLANMGPSVTAPRVVTQDMPPPGGFAPIRIRRNNPKKFFHPTTVMIVGSVIVIFGWYKYFFSYTRQQQIEHERYIMTELAMNPFLQAEKDIILAVERRAFRKKVQELREVDDELRNDPDFNADWENQFFKLSKKYTYPMNESYRYVSKENLSVSLKGTGLPQREKEYLEKLRATQ